MTKKQKPVYTVSAYDDATATAVYSCLKTACEQWGCIDNYNTIWRHLRNGDSYCTSKLIIKKHYLIRSAYVRKA